MRDMFVLKRGVIGSNNHLNWFFRSVCRGFGLHILHILCRHPIQCDTVSQLVIAEANLFQSVCRWVSFELVLVYDGLAWQNLNWCYLGVCILCERSGKSIEIVWFFVQVEGRRNRSTAVSGWAIYLAARFFCWARNHNNNNNNNNNNNEDIRVALK